MFCTVRSFCNAFTPECRVVNPGLNFDRLLWETSGSRQRKPEKAGIIGPIGWHTFRRSISTGLIDNAENVKVTQELMPYAQSKTTLEGLVMSHR